MQLARPQQKTRRILGLGASALFAMALLPGCKSKTPEPVTGPQAVRVTQGRQGPIAEGRDYLGELVSVRQVKVLAQVPGSITALPFEEGATVSGGDELARIAAPEISARLARVRAERGRAERERDFLCKRVKTDRKLVAAGDLPSDALDMGEKNCRASRMAVKAAKAGEREASVFTARSTERAPFDGVLIDRLVEIGQTVGPGAPLMVLGSTARELSVSLPQDDLNPLIKVGAKVRLAHGEGTIRRIGTRARGPGRTLELRITPDATPTSGSADTPRGAIGAIERVRFVVDARSDAALVPLEAIGHHAQGTFIVIVRDTAAERLPVTLGPKADGWIAIEPAPPKDARIALGAVAQIDVSRPVLPVEVQP